MNIPELRNWPHYLLVSGQNPVRVRMCKTDYTQVSESEYEKDFPIVTSEEFTLRSQETPEPESKRYRKPALQDFEELNPVTIPDMETGDVIGCSNVTGYADADGQIGITGAVACGKNMTDNEFVSFVIDSVKKDVEYFHHNTEATYDKVMFDTAADTARNEENTVLIAAWNDEQGDLKTYIIAHSGAYMFWSDGGECGFCGLDEPEEPGLWVLENGVPWSTGDGMWEEHDSGMDGDMVPATEERARAISGLDTQSLAREFLDVMDIGNITLSPDITFTDAVALLNSGPTSVIKP